MTVSKAWIRFAVGVALICALIGGSPLFAGEAIHNGVDLWMTVAGFAKTSFAQEPIPAGFFCEGSQPFTGTVKFKGAPLTVEPAGSLGAIDTVVRFWTCAPAGATGPGGRVALCYAVDQPFDPSQVN